MGHDICVRLHIFLELVPSIRLMLVVGVLFYKPKKLM